jgi:hypothetical protein
MRGTLKWMIVVGLWLMLLGSITGFAPRKQIIELNPGESYTFEAGCYHADTALVWYLDREEVARDTSAYTFTAGQNATGAPVHHRIMAKEQWCDDGDDQHSWKKRWRRHWKRKFRMMWCVVVLPDGSSSNTYYRDADGDGYGDPNNPAASADPQAPEGYVDNSKDCNDDDAAINPGATEACDKVDNNCNGKVDEGDVCGGGDQYTYYRDADGDGYGNPSDSVTSSESQAPDGYTDNGNDCNDDDAAINPSATEVCDQVDNNCNNETDEGGACGDEYTYYRDADGDGYGDPNDSVTSADSNAPDGYVDNGGDCNDGDAAINPGATEVCDQVDNNCNNETDEGGACGGGDEYTYYRDVDGDGYGDPNDSVTSADPNAPDGYVDNSGDCNDDDAAINPDATEVCDQVDNNCNNETDEGVCNDYTYYRDADGDGYGDPNDSVTSADPNAPDGYVDNSGDCDDGDAAIHPGAEDIADNIDNDCDGEIDEDSGTLQAPANVSASDIESGLTYIAVTWDASAGATYYKVYRAIYEEDAEYELVADNITDTSYDYVQDWQTDVYDIIGPNPAMAPDADEAQRAAFGAALEVYRTQALPVLFNFKAPAFFKIEACNEQGCSEMSDFDAGQAEYIHTAEESELAQLVIPSWGYPLLVAMADSPPGTDALGWCGIDICGSAGGLVMGRLAASGFNAPQVDIHYENYTEGWDLHPNARFVVNGYMGGEQNLFEAMVGVVRVSGESDITVGDRSAHLFAYSYIGGTSGDPNSGYISLTYNGETHQYTLPVQPVDGQDYADPPVPTVQDDGANAVDRRDTDYPVPFSEEPNTECSNWSDDMIVQCH